VTRYVAQEGDKDCGVAVLAMLTDRTLAEARQWIDWSGDPLKPHQMYYWLWSDGCFLRSVKLRSDLGTGEWLAPRFAPAHYAMVTATKGGHWTVVDGDGKLLDPFDASRESMEVYGAVHEIVGVIRSLQ
jgi:hypothetical protein